MGIPMFYRISKDINAVFFHSIVDDGTVGGRRQGNAKIAVVADSVASDGTVFGIFQFHTAYDIITDSIVNYVATG